MNLLFLLVFREIGFESPSTQSTQRVRISPMEAQTRRYSNKMMTKRYRSEDLVALFREQTVATLADCKRVLGTHTEMTVFRKLREIGGRSSYSHRGKYYALEESLVFDEGGLWSFESVRFSKYGSLLATAEAWVHRSPAGYFARELRDLLQVSVKEALLTLFRRERVAREKRFGLYLYCSADSAIRRRQLLQRAQASPTVLIPGFAGVEAVPDEVKAAIVLFVSTLDEKQRRLYAGLESLKLGRSGDRKLAELLCLDVHTVARGRRQLLTQDFEVDRVRKAGGGRKSVEKKRRQ